MTRRILVAILLTAVLAGAAGAAARFGHGVAVLTSTTVTKRVRVEVATTRAELERGLKFRRRLAPDAGMVFLFASPVRVQFWMKDTLIPLSIAFFDKTGKIVRIRIMTPCLHDPCRGYDSGYRIKGALEVRRGSFRRWGIGVGDHVAVQASE